MAVVVDDDAALRDMLAVALTRCGYSVVAAADGMEALRVISLHGGNVALVLSDMSMPLVDGERLARILGVYYPHIPVALMSGAPDPTAPSRLPGVRRWLSKPFSIEALDELERSTSPARPA